MFWHGDCNHIVTYLYFYIFAIMKGISNLNDLLKELETNEQVWLLLLKKGSEKSDCAFKNFSESESESSSQVLLYADVNTVRDIHSKFNITSVPTFINFEKGQLKNIVKGCQTVEQLHMLYTKKAFVSSNDEDIKPSKNVTVYTTPTCTWCTTVKRHLQENGIRFREIDVSADQNAAAEMVKKSGQQGVPQTDINGQIVVGFDKTKINALLGIN